MQNINSKAVDFFNVRVYAMLINAEKEVLIAEEFHYNTFMRKFPGGGLEFGEGIYDCIIRELKEELDMDVKEALHLYTTDFFIQSAFNSKQQVIAIYYTVKADDKVSLKYREQYNLPDKNGTERFRWKKINEISADDFTLPADIAAASVLKEKWNADKLNF